MYTGFVLLKDLGGEGWVVSTETERMVVSENNTITNLSESMACLNLKPSGDLKDKIDEVAIKFQNGNSQDAANANDNTQMNGGFSSVHVWPKKSNLTPEQFAAASHNLQEAMVNQNDQITTSHVMDALVTNGTHALDLLRPLLQVVAKCVPNLCINISMFTFHVKVISKSIFACMCN